MGKVISFVVGLVVLVLMGTFATFFMILKVWKDQERIRKYENCHKFDDK